MDDFKVINGIKIDPKIFTFRFSCRCSGECCYYGVYADLKEHEKILSLKDRIIPLMDETQTKDPEKWFEAPAKDEDFESGVAVGTELFNNKCVFLDKQGLCTLQKLALNEGKYQWEYKPLYCVLFPLTVYENTLTIDDDHMNRLSTCNRNGMPEKTIYEACIDELRHFFGDEAFAKLQKYREDYLSMSEVQ